VTDVEPDPVVLDASALLAMLQSEPGSEAVGSLMDHASISTVNWSEVFQKAIDHGIPTDGLREDLEALGLAIVPFSAAQAEGAAYLRSSIQSFGLSLADRACLALAADLGLQAVTVDRAWGDLSIGGEVRVLR